MPNMQSIRTILWWSHSNLHPVCSIWANDRIYFLKCLVFSIFKIPPELVCMILQPYYEWWSILLSYYDSVTHSKQICQRIGFGKWFALALKVSWLLAGRRLDCCHPLGRPAGIKQELFLIFRWEDQDSIGSVSTQNASFSHHFRLRERPSSGRFRPRDLTGVPDGPAVRKCGGTGPLCPWTRWGSHHVESAVCKLGETFHVWRNLG